MGEFAFPYPSMPSYESESGQILTNSIDAVHVLSLARNIKKNEIVVVMPAFDHKGSFVLFGR